MVFYLPKTGFMDYNQLGTSEQHIRIVDMPRIPKTVFISYRRTNQAHAIKIYQLLQEAGYDPFLDVKDLGAGAWRVIIQREIQRRAHFVLLLTPSAVKRFAEPHDVMRFEIETALDNKRNIVPLTFEGFSYSDPLICDYLTGKLAILSEYNAFPINWRRLKKDIQAIIDRFMSIHPDDVVHPDAMTRGDLPVERGIPQDTYMADDGAIVAPLSLNDMPTVEQPTREAEQSLPSAPQTSVAKSGATGWLLAILGAPLGLVNALYQQIRHWFSPQPPALPTPPVSPAPAPQPESTLAGGIMTNEAELLLMMRQVVANLPPVSDDQLALEEAQERG